MGRRRSAFAEVETLLYPIARMAAPGELRRGGT
jgi:hypothetical protein